MIKKLFYGRVSLTEAYMSKYPIYPKIKKKKEKKKEEITFYIK